jgi:ABC-type transport system involved in cytochrome c biogenesis permease subunit
MVLSFLLVILAAIQSRHQTSHILHQTSSILHQTSSILHPLTFLFLITGWGLRWYISGFIPLSNGYETMYFAAICLLVVPMFARRTMFIAAFAAAFILVVAHLGEKNPQITPLMPVLHSPWLSAHVSIVMMSYALLIVSIAERRLLRLAVFLLATGIFLGAVWANVSWGTYWNWDPKESWALITLIVYAIPLHHASLPWFRSDRNYRLYSVLALLCLLMTYFGVNHLLGGLHSYA